MEPTALESIPRPTDGPAAASAKKATGYVRFAPADERDAASVRLERSGFVVIELEGVGPSTRGRLGDVLGEAIDEALATRGASGPGIAAGSDRDATLSDQLFRLRRAGCEGLAIVLGPLRAAAGPTPALDPADSETLRFLAEATRDRPLVLLLDARDVTTGAYGAPVPLESLLVPAAALAVAPPALVVEPVACPEPPPPRPSPAVASPPPRHTAGAAVVAKEETWRAWTLQLTAARGPQPLTVLEKLFTESYMPLANAIAGGLDDPRARHACDEFASTFAKGYSDSFPTFTSTTKRPRMVFDAHDTAARIGRLHGARATRVLIVDAMRWDIARLIEERVLARLGDQAVLTDEFLLWSALPTTSQRQLETIARGIEALRSPVTLEPDPDPPRGRTAEYVRRMRVGPREIHKLDVVQARVQTARGTLLGELPEIADVAADAIARHCETCSPRTLLLVTGDHGFRIDRNGCARQDGASPEEVLVGAFTLLLGEVH